MTRENGFESVTVREIGKRLGMSSTPIFTLFKNMDEVKREIRKLPMKESKLFRILYMQENIRTVRLRQCQINKNTKEKGKVR